MTEQKNIPVEKEMSFLDHLEELRWHLIRSAIAIFVIAILVFVFRDFVFDKIIMGPKKSSFITYQFFCGLSEATCFSPPEFKLLPRQMGEQFYTTLKVSAWLGFILAFPYIFWEFWKFIKPGLYKNEQKATSGVVIICSALFLLGVLFGYLIISPFAISFLVGFSVSPEIVSSPTLASYVSNMTMFTIPTGLLFELPIVVYFLSRIGVLTPAFMKKFRRHAIVLIFVLAAIITPPDITTQFLIGIPIILLYEVSILISARVEKKYHSDS